MNWMMQKLKIYFESNHVTKVSALYMTDGKPVMLIVMTRLFRITILHKVLADCCIPGIL